MYEPPLPIRPNPALVQRYTEREAQLEVTHPTGEPDSFVCHLVLSDGGTCNRRRVLAGRPGNKVLMCPSCDQPDPSNAMPGWTDAEA